VLSFGHQDRGQLQMSEALVALIAAASGIFGAAISGWITYRTTNRQVQARLDELREQLQQDRKEARKGRLIEARKDNLHLLREVLSNPYSYYLNMRVNAMRIELLKEKGLPAEPLINAGRLGVAVH
jgi:type VI protein secretion system component VasK